MLIRLFLGLAALLPSICSGEMYKCERSDGVIVFSNIACRSTDKLISIDGVSAKEINRIENDKKRLAAEQDQAKARAEENRRSDESEKKSLAPKVSALDHGVRCEIEVRSGLVQKIITYSVDGKTYAINGQARGRAALRGWTDGSYRFSPVQMQTLLQEGLGKC